MPETKPLAKLYFYMLPLFQLGDSESVMLLFLSGFREG
jgi:hypothetical protein